MWTLCVGLVCLTVLTGCAVFTTDLAHPTRPSIRCQWWGVGFVGVPLAAAERATCVERAQKQGYTVVE